MPTMPLKFPLTIIIIMHVCMHDRHAPTPHGEACRGDASRRSKGDRRTSRRAAVETLAAMSTGGAVGTPQVVRCAGGQRVEISTVAQKVVYREVAAVLQSGMNAHVQHNIVLGELLGMDMDGMHCGPGGKVCILFRVSISRSPTRVCELKQHAPGFKCQCTDFQDAICDCCLHAVLNMSISIELWFMPLHGNLHCIYCQCSYSSQCSGIARQSQA